MFLRMSSNRPLRWPLGVLLLVSASLAGCVSLLSVHTLPTMLPATWDARRETLQSWGRFDSHGRVAIARESEGFSGAWRWSQRAQRSTLELDGPLGVGGLRIEFEAEEASNVSSRRALEEQLGVSFRWNLCAIGCWAFPILGCRSRNRSQPMRPDSKVFGNTVGRSRSKITRRSPVRIMSSRGGSRRLASRCGCV